MAKLAALYKFLLLAGLVVVLSQAERHDCRTNSDCKRNRMFCKHVDSPTCGGVGYCACIPGFVFKNFSTSMDCVRAVEPRGKCRRNVDQCLSTNTNCTNGVCLCERGYHTHKLFPYCLLKITTKLLGELCHDPRECLPTLTCDGHNRCVCAPGMTQDGLLCRGRMVGDYCKVDSDCQLIGRASCLNQSCQCTYGHYTYRYRSTPITAVVGCYAESTPPLLEGQGCNPRHNTTRPCTYPFVCSFCSTSAGYVCARITPLMGTFNGQPGLYALSPSFLILLVLSVTIAIFGAVRSVT